MTDEPPSLRNLSKEIFDGGYLQRARERAQRRKSPWNLALIPLVFGGIGLIAYLLFHMMWLVHVAIYPAHAGRLGEFWRRGISAPAFVSSSLLLVPLLVAAIPLGMLLANCIAWCVGPARKVFEHEARGVKWASFRESMAGLARVALIVVPVCLLLSVLGALTLKSLR